MIEIIGKDPKHFKQCTCSKCANILKYTEDSVETLTYKDYSGSTDTDYFIRCPSCGHKIIVR